MRRMLTTAAVAAALLAAGCSSSPGTAGPGLPGIGGAGQAGTAVPALTLRLGFVPGVTQAPALIGLRDRLFASALGPAARLRAVAFPSDAAEQAALAAGKLDAAYASPGTILSLTKAGKGIRIISGTASGGAELVVKPGISSPARLSGATLAVPAAGSAEDIALRYWLQHNRLNTPGSGSVAITSPDPAAAVREFAAGRISGAWEPAPYDIEMVNAGGRVLVNEASLWPAGRFATANLIVTTTFLEAHTGIVLSLLKGQVQANSYLHQQPLQAVLAVQGELAALRDTSVPPTALTASLAQVTFTDDPIAASLLTQSQHAGMIGMPRPAGDLTSLYDLAPLDLLLREAGQPPAAP